MIRGKISKLLPLNGFGFIASAALAADTRFDSSVVEGTSFEDVYEGQQVEFVCQRLDWATSPQAILVRPIPSAEEPHQVRPQEAARR